MSIPDNLTLTLSADQQTDVLTAIRELMAYVDTKEQADRMGAVANAILVARGEPAETWWGDAE
ncbi:MAG: hypothetical protein Q4C67_03730 [Deinococcus sp.]|nr:hypothetical protein [Deinococcus sp.]